MLYSAFRNERVWALGQKPRKDADELEQDKDRGKLKLKPHHKLSFKVTHIKEHPKKIGHDIPKQMLHLGECTQSTRNRCRTHLVDINGNDSHVQSDDDSSSQSAEQQHPDVCDLDESIHDECDYVDKDEEVPAYNGKYLRLKYLITTFASNDPKIPPTGIAPVKMGSILGLLTTISP